MRRCFPFSCLVFGAMVGLSTTSPAQEVARPNIVLITADDLGCQIGCYGDQTVPTPHLDSLFADGVRFDRAFVTQASCSSSRSSIFTGLYPHENGQIGLSHRGFSMHDGLVTFPALLKEAGYYNGVIGKVHVQPAKDVPFDFDTNKRQLRGSQTNNVQLVREYIEKFFAEKSSGPFFLMVNYFDPHHPAGAGNHYIYEQINGLPEQPVTVDQVEPFPFLKDPDAEMRKNVAGYYNCVKRLDVGVGMLLELLAKEGCDENTLVVFLGDHGPPFPRAKITSYEAGLQVPLLVRWPGHTLRRHSCDQMVSTIDIMPTLLDAAGIAIPDRLQGRSLLPLLEGETPPWRSLLFAENNWHTQTIFRPQRTVREDRYKLILSLSDQGADRVELFDLQRDPHEFSNLAERDDLRSVRERLLESLEAWRRATNDPLLEPGEIAAQRAKYYESN